MTKSRIPDYTRLRDSLTIPLAHARALAQEMH